MNFNQNIPSDDFVYFPVIAVQTCVCCEKAIIGLRLSFVIQRVVCLTVH